MYLLVNKFIHTIVGEQKKYNKYTAESQRNFRYGSVKLMENCAKKVLFYIFRAVDMQTGLSWGDKTVTALRNYSLYLLLYGNTVKLHCFDPGMDFHSPLDGVNALWEGKEWKI